MRAPDFLTVALVGLVVYQIMRACSSPRAPGVHRVEQIAPDYIPGVGAAPPGMEWDVNFAGEWVPVDKL